VNSKRFNPRTATAIKVWFALYALAALSIIVLFFTEAALCSLKQKGSPSVVVDGGKQKTPGGNNTARRPN